MKTNIFLSVKPLATLMAVVALVAVSCKDKPKSGDIIVKKPATTVRKAVQSMPGNSQTRRVEWLDGTYSITVVRKADTSLPQAVDEQGNRYYDNRITLTIRRPDGTTFFSRTFAKADFVQYVDDGHSDGALLGIVFDRTDGGSLRFAASVGSPDAMSDEYVPMVLTVSRGGGVTISKDTQLDTTSDAAAAQDDDEGV